MGIRQLTENDVVLANHSFLRDLCSRCGKRLEPEERFSTAQLGFLCAIRNHDVGLAPFHPYAEQVVRLFLESSRKGLDQLMRLESPLSLDQPAVERGGAVGTVLVWGVGDIVGSILFRDFLNSLGDELCFIARLIVYRYTKQEIMALLGLSRYELECRYTDILYQWEQYNGLAS